MKRVEKKRTALLYYSDFCKVNIINNMCPLPTSNVHIDLSISKQLFTGSDFFIHKKKKCNSMEKKHIHKWTRKQCCSCHKLLLSLTLSLFLSYLLRFVCIKFPFFFYFYIFLFRSEIMKVFIVVVATVLCHHFLFQHIHTLTTTQQEDRKNANLIYAYTLFFF